LGPVQKADIIIVQKIKRKVSSSSLRRARAGQIAEQFIGGSILLSQGGEFKTSAKASD
jgi:hypothetical protein